MKNWISVAGFIFVYCLASLRSFGDCDAPPAGLVAWWQAEGNANDSANLNAGTANNLIFASGEVGHAFDFNGSNSFVQVPASASLNVGASGGLSVETWINPSDISQPRPILQWSLATTPPPPDFGVSLWISVPPTNGGSGEGCLLIDLKDWRSQHRIVCTPPGLINAGVWQHAAATYDKISGIASLYLNGSLVLQTNIGNLAPYTTQDFFIGHETDLDFGDKLFINNGQAWFAGLIDELSLYNRALSGPEIQSLFNAGSAGKCPMAPTGAQIQPANQSVAEGESETFAAYASGSPVLVYQWSLNGTNILGATNSFLTLTNVQLTDAGSYTVSVSNEIGAFTSAPAILSVLPSYVPVWAQTTLPTNLSWSCAASSADGKKLVAGCYEGFLYTSSDGGLTWASNNVPQLSWQSIVSSADGTQVAAAAEETYTKVGLVDGGIYTSTNSGATWQLSISGNAIFAVGSRDGAKLMFPPDVYHVATSTNAGASWTTNSSPGLELYRVACSADATKIAAVDVNNDVFTSVDFGNSWKLTSAPNSYYWTCIASSADGIKLFTGSSYGMLDNSTNAVIYTSANSGNQWMISGAPLQPWVSLACSDDGSKLVAGTWPGYLYLSTDSGTNWTVTRAPVSDWTCVASSADGTTLIAGQNPGSLYIWKPTALSISIAGANLEISWPTNQPNFILQEKNTLGSSTWVNVTNLPIVTNALYQTILPAGNDSQMFRLAYP